MKHAVPHPVVSCHPTHARRLGFLAAALCSALITLAAAPLSARSPLRVGDAPPAVGVTDLGGRQVRIPDDLKGKVVLVHFWASGCSSCKEEMPAMESLHNRYQKKGLAIAAINVGQRRDAVKSYVAGLKVTYPIYLDPDTAAARAYEVVGVPKTVILDRNGVIRYKILGSASTESLTKLVNSLL